MERTEELRARMQEKYPLREIHVPIAGRTITLTTAEDIEELIERIPAKEFLVDERMPYWAELWHSAVALAQYIETHPAMFDAYDTLDLGCGLGLEGIAAALNGARVTFADYDADALLAAELNALQNGAGTGTECRLLDFREKPERRWERIIAADIVYEKRFIDPLLVFIEAALADDGVMVISEPNRTVAEGFFQKLESAGFAHTCEQMPASLHGRTVNVGIHHIEKKKK